MTTDQEDEKRRPTRPKGRADGDRRARLAAALRENLKRRKRQRQAQGTPAALGCRSSEGVEED